MRLAASILLAFSVASVAAETLVEFSNDKAPLSGLAVGTCEYEPTAVEKPFNIRLSEEGRSTIEAKPDEFRAKGGVFSLHGHEGEFVSWFGIVRHITRTGWPRQGRVVIQNTYASELTDCHKQTFEINGGGDFEAELSNLPDDLIPLVLVRVYGFVQRANNALPVVTADYVRVWHLFQFNFMDFGVDHSNPEWRQRMHLPPGESVYHIGGSPKYYEERLGPTPEQWREIREFHRRQTELEFEREGLEPMDPSSRYQPTELENDYYAGLPEIDRVTVNDTKREPHAVFQLRGHVDGRVSWFGIVRQVTPHGIGRRGGVLLVENKYFDGAKDEKLQTVSIRGGGNFVAEVTNLSDELQPLLLVRVYGRVLREENGLPFVKVAFLRGWRVGQYNFNDYGDDERDARWSQEIRLKPGEPVRQSAVTAEYYIDRLSPTLEQIKMIREHFENEAARDEFEHDLLNSPVEEVTVDERPPK